MNFLAHLYLSGDDVDIRLGNFIGDHVKGRFLSRYSDGVQRGIFLHRAIDYFTDNHTCTSDIKQHFREGYGKYAGVVVDIFYDHFLAHYWGSFSPYPLKNFTRKFYYQMVQRYRELPRSARNILPFIIQSNRLYTYHSIDGIRKTMEIMSRTTSLPDQTDYAISTLLENYIEIRTQFQQFIFDIIDYIEREHGIVPSGYNRKLIAPGAIELKEYKEEDGEGP